MGNKTIEMNKTKDIKKIESYLKNYNTYVIGIKNLQKQLEYIIPGFCDEYKLNPELNGMFVRTSEKGGYALDRVVSRKAFVLYEDLERYKIIVNSINDAMTNLEEVEFNFINLRYVKGKSIVQTSMELGYSEKYLFTLRKKILNKLLISLNGLFQL